MKDGCDRPCAGECSLGLRPRLVVVDDRAWGVVHVPGAIFLKEKLAFPSLARCPWNPSRYLLHKNIRR
jgi:hypothetical protein